MGYKPKFSWSYTRWSAFETCKFKYQQQYIKKLDVFKFVESPASERGNKIHLLAEQHTKGEITGMPDDLKKFEHEFKTIKRLGAIAEEDWVIDKNWNKVAWNDWNNAWGRSKTDFHLYTPETHVLDIGDHKTGKQYDSHKDQGHLYATKGFHFYPEAKEINVEFWYLDLGTVTHLHFKAKEKDSMTKLWSRRARKMEVQQIFPATKNDKCKWCPLGDHRYGDASCPAWKK